MTGHRLALAGLLVLVTAGAVEVDWFPPIPPDGPTRPTGPAAGRPGSTG